MSDNAFWAAVFTLTFVPGGAALGCWHSGPGLFARIGGLWIGAVLGWFAIQPLFGFVTMPFFEALGEMQRLLSPFNLVWYVGIVVLASPGLGLLWLQDKLNARRRSLTPPSSH